MLRILEDNRDAKREGRSWPDGCIWPEPLREGEGEQWDLDTVYMLDLDEEGMDLLSIREYYDDLVEEGILNDDYTISVDLDEETLQQYEFRYSDDEEGLEFWPALGEEYWFDGFDIEMWEQDLNDHLNMLKIGPYEPDPVAAITETIRYKFINENLLRQAFTRRAFALEYGLTGCSEELEFIGDTVLSMVVTREMTQQLAKVEMPNTDAPFQTDFDEGDFSRIRSKYVCKEYLAARAAACGLDEYILYGSNEEHGESSREDMVEALIGAVVIDSNWSWDSIENVIDSILCIQLSQPGLLLRETYYDKFNAWHQKHFGCMPVYEVHSWGQYWCTVRYFVPENDKGIEREHKTEVAGDTRSEARELAAEIAFRYIAANGLWINLRDAGVEPRLEDSINQLQELYQKKYVEEGPTYTFEEYPGDTWRCNCECGGVFGIGTGPSKTAAKKKAAYIVIVKLLDAAGLCRDEWRDQMYELM